MNPFLFLFFCIHKRNERNKCVEAPFAKPFFFFLSFFCKNSKGEGPLLSFDFISFFFKALVHIPHIRGHLHVLCRSHEFGSDS